MTLVDERLLRLIYAPSPVGDAVLKAKSGDWSLPYCEAPVRLQLRDTNVSSTHPIYSATGCAEVWVPCRRCRACRWLRARSWYARALAECGRSERTWLLTWTFRGSSPPTAYKPVQDTLRAARRVGIRFRFLAVQEFGERNGRVHWHLLVHTAADVKKAALHPLWKHGFHDTKLVQGAPDEALGYIAHYASKSMAKVHASKHYGRLGAA